MANNPLGACYLTTNSANLSNLGEYELANGNPVFDIGIIFAANINGSEDSPELYFNDTVTQALNSGVVAQLQAKGIKVLLSILGNHQPAGITTLTGNAPQSFARQLSDAIDKYGLDGIDFDDEYSTGTSNDSSFVELVSSLRQRQPNTIISFYYYGPATQYQSYNGVHIGDLINYSWNAIYSTYVAPDVPGLNNSELSAAAVNMNPSAGTYTSPSLAAQFATDTLRDGYGAYLYYNLLNGDQSSYLTSITQALYGQDTIYTGP